MDKSAEAFRTISEVSEALDTPAHVLRFWESRFPQIKPVKRAGGRRYYRPADVALLGGIRKLLHDDGLTIRGVQKLLKERGVRYVSEISGFDPADLPEDPAGGVRVPDGAPGQPVDPVVAAVAAMAPTGSPTFPQERPAETGSGPVAEAPMMVDAPELPFGSVSAFPPVIQTRQPAAGLPAAGSRPDLSPEPAATLLRAMDALRARDKRDELRSVYDRLSALRKRISGDAGPG
jgi:DNA-binding transcriptional MerR regulator